VRYDNGARGVLHASQISCGEENGLNIRIYGEKASLHWRQEQPNDLTIKFADKPAMTLRPGNGYNCKSTTAATRLPAGHPEAFLEAFANIYREAAKAIRAEVSGKKQPKSLDFPNVDDGVEGMAFIASAVKSSKSKSKWTKMLK